MLVKSAKSGTQFGGVIYSDSADKAARFILNCNQKRLPLVFLQDVTGFMVGSKSEQGGIIKDGAKLVNAMANSSVPVHRRRRQQLRSRELRAVRQGLRSQAHGRLADR